MLLEDTMLRSQHRQDFADPHYPTAAHDQIRVDAEPLDGITSYVSHPTNDTPVMPSVRYDPPGFDYDFHDRNLRIVFTAVHNGELGDIDEKIMTMSRYFCSDMKPRGKLTEMTRNSSSSVDMRLQSFK
jgi:hypothetical protein